MGVLDSEPTREARLVADQKRREVLRANLRENAEKMDMTYDDAVLMFAQQIGRKRATVYGWMTGKSVRPMPPHYYQRLVATGHLDPTLVPLAQRP